MNIKALWRVWVMALVVAAGCSESTDEPQQPVSPPASQTEEQEEKTDRPEATWAVPEYAVARVSRYSRTELIDRLVAPYSDLAGSAAISALKAAIGYGATDDATYHEAVLTYASTDHRGEPITLSGIVSFKSIPAGSSAIEQMVVSSHPTITDNPSCPGEGGDIAELLMLSGNTAVVAADYQGYGHSRGAIHPYLNEALTARQQTDLLKAAIDYLCTAESGATLSASLTAYSVGYSQGGAVALAVHRRLESDDADLGAAIGFSGSVCGDGPYNLAATLEAYQSQGFVSMPVVLPMMVRGMMESYPELFGTLTLDDYFTAEFLGAGGGLMALVDAKELNVMEYNTLLGAANPLDAQFPLESILKPEALAPGSPALTAILNAAALNNCIVGWTPRHPVAFFHSRHDTVVPYSNLDDLDAWSGDIYTVTHPALPGADHLACALLFYKELLQKGPAGML